MIETIVYGSLILTGFCGGCWFMLKVHLRTVNIQCNSLEPPISDIDEPRLTGLERYYLETGIEA